MKPYVGSMPFSMDESKFRSMFGEFGTVVDAAILTDNNTGQSRGFGFVTLDNRRDASRAVEQLNGFDLDGREIVVKAASER